MAAAEAAQNLNIKKKNQDDATILASSLMEQVNREDIASMVYIQRDMLSRFEKTNEMLINFNILSASRYEATIKDFQKHTQLLFDMKKIWILYLSVSACSSIYAVASDCEEDSSDDGDDDSDETEHTAVQSQEVCQETSTNPEPKSQNGESDAPLVTITDIGSPTSSVQT